MRIAIVAPSAVPFCIGGAENLWWGLLDHINQHTSHQAELIKVPCPDGTFWDLVDSYRLFSGLNMSGFDAVISTKYPAWMVQHPNHVCYLQHRLRGLYDTYHFAQKPLGFVSADGQVKALQGFMKENQGNRAALDAFFEQMDALRGRTDLPAETFEFPGPFIRQIIHFLDGVALSTTAIRRFAAIAHNVAGREDYFPAGADVEIIYHPSNLSHFREGADDYLFTVSRLDGPKRISVIVEAMKHVKSDIELRIAGTGPDGERLREMAADDPRIKFLGFVNDQEVINQYADALAVPYIPYDEDYGLVTIEAMKCAKPVLTSTVSGGPNEFVVNGETGFSVVPEPAALAEKIDYLCDNRDIAKSMGQRAKEKVSGITWENTVSRLIALADPATGAGKSAAPARPSAARPRRRKITATVTFPVYPPRGGGQSRLFHLYRHLASEYDIDVITFTNTDQPAFNEEIAPGLREIRIPKSSEHHHAESDMSQQVDWVPITDAAMPSLYRMTPDYLEALKQSTATADIVIACHPWLLPAIRQVSDKPLWFDAHDVELELKRKMLPDNEAGRRLVDQIWLVEKEACDISELIMVCSHADGNTLSRIYGTDPKKFIEVPNGVDLETVSSSNLEQRRATKQGMGLSDSFTALFVGSWHEPNLDAVRAIVGYAHELPDVNFLIMGSVGLAFGPDKPAPYNMPIPANLGFMGVVDDDTKDAVLSFVDVALNPMPYGTGTNLKMLDYCAAGIPVISTMEGVRGLALTKDVHIDIADEAGFPDAIRALRQSYGTLADRVERAKQCVITRYDWGVIARNFADEVRQRGC